MNNFDYEDTEKAVKMIGNQCPTESSGGINEDTIRKYAECGVDYISSAGWGIFISHIKDVRDHGGDIKLANMIPNVYEIYELLEFDNVLQAYNSVDRARDKFDLETSSAKQKKKRRK